MEANHKKEDFRIVCGTYEKLIYGIDAFWGKINSNDDDVEMKNTIDEEIPNVDPKLAEKQKKIDETSLGLASNNKALRLNPIFIYPSHISYIKCIGIGGHHMASGGTDEVIKLYDLKKRKEVGTLLHHSGTITCLTFFQKTHMLSSGEDGEICLWRTKDWEKLSSFKGHKSGVTCVAIHPSGKLALSISTDKTLRCWNLVEGKAAYTLKIYRKDALKIFWNVTGTLYGIMFDREVIVYDAGNPNQSYTFSHKGRINDFRFLQHEGKDYLVTGNEDKKVRLYDIKAQKCIGQWDNGSETRIKCIDVMDNENVTLLCTCSSDGIINVWDLTGIFDLIEMAAEDAEEEKEKEGKENSGIMKDLEDVEPISRYKTGCRITCVSFAPPIQYNDEVEEEKEKENNEENDDKEEEEKEESKDEDPSEKPETVNTNKNTNKNNNKNNNKTNTKRKKQNNKRKRKNQEGQGKNKKAK
jgi:protein MAK11